MAILNYSTKIDSHKTCGEIQSYLARKGARAISIDYEGSDPVALTFLLVIGSDEYHYRLPSEPTGVLSAMQCDKKIPRSMCNREQATRVSWRILKDWVEAQVALIEANSNIRLEQVMLPYLVTDSGKTLYQVFTERRLLTAGS